MAYVVAVICQTLRNAERLEPTLAAVEVCQVWTQAAVIAAAINALAEVRRLLSGRPSTRPAAVAKQSPILRMRMEARAGRGPARRGCPVLGAHGPRRPGTARPPTCHVAVPGRTCETNPTVPFPHGTCHARAGRGW
jgi:hypothetical protein